MNSEGIPALEHRQVDGTMVIGVTGHRDIRSDDEHLRQAVVRELDRLSRESPGTRMVLLSCLAEGADRLVARLAIDHLAAELVAVLPMPPRDYRRDFASTASRREFDALLHAADRRVVLFDGGAQATPLRGAGRTRQYACAGAYIVERSSVLIALWDGKPARGVGGTAQLVHWMLAGEIPPEYSLRNLGRDPLPMRRPGSVVHIDPRSCRVTYLGGRFSGETPGLEPPG